MEKKKVVRDYISKVTRTELTLTYGNLCFYCQQEPAQSVDHVIPFSAGGEDTIENLRPCCLWCNLTASNKIFKSIDDKITFLIEKKTTLT